MHLLAVRAAGILDHEAVVPIAGGVPLRVLDAHVGRDTAEQQRIDAVGLREHEIDQRGRKSAWGDLAEHALVRPRLQLVDDLVLALTHAVLRRGAQRPQLPGQIGVVLDLGAIRQEDTAQVACTEEVEQPLAVRHHLLGDARPAVVGGIELALRVEQRSEPGRRASRRVLDIDDDQADPLGLQLRLGRVDRHVVPRVFRAVLAHVTSSASLMP